MKRKRNLGVLSWILVLVMVCSLVTVPMKEVSASATNPAEIGKTSTSVTATITTSNIAGEYHEYYLQINNKSSESIGDWIVAIPVSGATKTEDWSSWAYCQAVYTSDYVYVYPLKDGVISAGGTFGSTSNDSYKFNYFATTDAANPIVYYVPGTSAINAFSSVISGANAGSSIGGGNSNIIAGTPSKLSDSTSAINTSIDYNFAKLLQESLYFYDANMCGNLTGSCSVNWRENCHLCDQTVNYNGQTVDVSGGFHDAGDHDKFGLPQAYAAVMLGISYYEYPTAFTKTGQVAHLKKITDYFCDYFERCTVLDSSNNAIAFCYQVGDGASHNYWVAPENENISRPAYFANSSNPATDQVSLAAAALTMNYLNFGDSSYLECAKRLFAMAKNNSNKAAKTSDNGTFYESSSWQDDYCLAAALLYKATNDATYKTEYDTYKGSMALEAWPSWDQIGPYTVAYGEDNWAPLGGNVSSTMKKCTNVDNGYAWLCKWASARYNCNMQLEGLLYDKHTGQDYYTSWAQGQMKYLMGNSNNKQCYIVGYSSNSSKYPHHRAASGYGGFPDNGYATTTQKYSLLGALVGGIENANGTYHDSASDYYCNEVTIDYNAALVGAAAALYLKNENDGKQNIMTADSADATAKSVIKTYYGSNSGTTEDTTQATTEKTTQATTEKTTQATTEKTTQVTTEKTTQTTTEKTTQATTEKTTQATTEKTTQATTEKTTQVTTEATTEAVTVAANSINLNKTSVALKINGTKTAQLTATVLPSNTTNKKVTYSTSNSKVATVSATGLITAKGNGTATITAKTSNGKKATCKVTVTTLATSIALNKTSVALKINGTKTTQLKATISPSTTSNKSVTYSTSNSKVATVSATGLVTAKGNGTATITAKTSNGKKATCKVAVTTLASSVSLNKTSLNVKYQGTATLKATVSPSNTSNKTITWSSSNTAVATVSSKGVVTGKKVGVATITAKTSNGKKVTCKVYVKYALTCLNVNGSTRSAMLVTAGTTVTLPTIAAKTGYKSYWQDTATGKYYYPGAKLKITRNVTLKTVYKQIYVSKIALNYTSLSMYAGRTFRLTAAVAPSTALNKNLYWKSSNTNVVIVSQGGAIKAVRKGVAYVKVYARDGSGKYALCKIVVK